MNDRLADGSSDRRWVILAEDGRFSTLGRARDPSEEEVLAVEVSLTAQGMAGWLAIMSHSVHAETFPEILEVRRLGQPQKAFEDAVASCKMAAQSR